MRLIIALSCLLSIVPIVHAADKKPPTPLSRHYDLQIDNVYAAVVQVASRDYNVKSAVKEGYSVTFFSGGQYPMVYSAIRRQEEDGKSLVSITVEQAVGNPQVFFVGKAKEKAVVQFWSELEKALQLNQNLRPESSKPAESNASAADAAQLIVRSTPDGADILIDGKFVGNTPSTLTVKGGDHSIRVEQNGFVPWEKWLSITAGGQITLNANLHSKTAEPPH